MVKVCLDYGHGGKDSGAIANGLKEKDIVLQIGSKVSKILEEHGLEVIQTRSSDIFIGLSQRAKIANRAKADIFVSLHCNSFVDPQAQGVEAYAYPNSIDGENLSRAILDSIISHKLYTQNRGVKTADFAVLRETEMTASLVELGFITNPEDADILTKQQTELATAVAKGMLGYLGISYVDQARDELNKEYEKAVRDLVDAGIISSPDLWTNLDKIHVNHVKSLVIKMAAYLNV